MDYRNLDKNDFLRFKQFLSRYIETKYSIKIEEKVTVDNDKYLGGYDGKCIYVKECISEEYKLFLIAHLFGHTVQLGSTDKYNNIESELPISSKKNKELISLKEYEEEAASYAIFLLNNSLDVDMQQWFSDWSAADWEYFIKIKDLDQKKENNNKLKLVYGKPLIESKAIPDFKVEKFETKYAY